VVGGRDLRLETFQKHLESVTGEAWKSVDTRACSGLLDRYLEQEAVLAASGHGADDARAVGETRDARVRTELRELCGPVPTVAPEDVEREVALLTDQIGPEQVHLRQLLVDSLEVAQDVRRRFAEGETFDELSRAVSRAPNAGRGGELGWFARGVLPEDVEEAVFGLEPGQLSKPVGGPGGYHIFQVVEIETEGVPDAQRVRQKVVRELEGQIGRQHLRSCLEQKLQTVGVRVFPTNLWFEYTGKYSEDIDETENAKP